MGAGSACRLLTLFRLIWDGACCWEDIRVCAYGISELRNRQDRGRTYRMLFIFDLMVRAYFRGEPQDIVPQILFIVDIICYIAKAAGCCRGAIDTFQGTDTDTIAEKQFLIESCL